MSVTASSSSSSHGVGSFLPRSPRNRRTMPRFTMAVRSDVVSVCPILTKLKQDCATPLPILQRVADAMALAMRDGLQADVTTTTGLPMIPTYVHTLPTGYSISITNTITSSFPNLILLLQYRKIETLLLVRLFILKKGMRKGCFMLWILVERTSVCFECSWAGNKTV